MLDNSQTSMPMRNGFRRGGLIFAALIALLVLFGSSSRRSEAKDSIQWIKISEVGDLDYGTDGKGNRVPDFSTVGYGSGVRPIPHVPVAERVLAPSGRDDTSIIQEAIDRVAALPLNSEGFRGAVELGVGEFQIRGTLRIAASGIVLRGQGENTVLIAKGLAKVLINLGGGGTWRRQGRIHRITDNYVPVGATAVHVDDANDLRAGDEIIVQRPFTEEWITIIGMNRLAPRSHGATKQWQPGPGLLFDRRISRIDGDSIVLDAALTNGISQDDNPVLWRYSFADRIRNLGLENFRVVGTEFFSTPDYATDTFRHSVFASFSALEEAWIRNVSIFDFATALTLRATSSHVTARDFKFRSPNNPRVSARPPVVSIDGQQNLITECDVSGRHFSAWVTQSAAPGPNVIYRCNGAGEDIGAGAHQRWATGALFDNVTLQGRMHIGNRGSFGTGHGWSGANSVVWNSTVTSYLIERPPTATNWAFGVTGEILRQNEPLGEIISPNRRVEPASLYQKQLSERMRPSSQ